MSRPHYTSSAVGLIGGGQVSMPGEVSLGHYGILFLDKRPECRRHVLRVLRQPLEKGIVAMLAGFYPAHPHWGPCTLALWNSWKSG